MRSKCALQMEKVRVQKDLPEIFKCCPNFPLPWGKKHKPSEFSGNHQSQSTETMMEEFHTASAEMGLTPEDACPAQQGAKGCKKKENISLFYQTKPGMLTLVHP